MTAGSRIRIVVAALSGFVMAMTLGGTTAMAGPFDNMYPTQNADWPCLDSKPNGLFCQTDNVTLTVWLGGALNSDTKTIVKERLSSQVSPTDITVSYPSKLVTAGSSETDIVYERSDKNMSGTTIGLTWCDDSVSATKCDQQYVRFRYAYIDAELACHETGHALGLTHGVNASPRASNTNSSLGCMETPDSGNRTTYGSWQTAEINATY